jgi:hypothetical protein
MEAGYLATLRRLHAAGMRTVVMTDTPAAPDEIPACVSDNLHDLDACAFKDPRGWDQEFESATFARTLRPWIERPLRRAGLLVDPR